MTRAAVLMFGSLLLLGHACRRDPPPAPPPAPAPAAAPAPPPQPPAPDAAVEAVAPVAAVEEAPLTPCQRKCSIGANHKQLQGFLRCEKAGAGAEACKAKVLEDTDAGRRACRERCERRKP